MSKSAKPKFRATGYIMRGGVVIYDAPQAPEANEYQPPQTSACESQSVCEVKSDGD